MIVITLTDCPPKLRGDLTKWLMEINTGVYVGNLSARVREQIWERVCQNIKSGRATMIYSANGEQGMSFKVHNSTWEPIDYEGIKLMRRPIPGKANSTYQHQMDIPYSDTAKMLQLKNIKKAQIKNDIAGNYVVADIETTGLDPFKHEIIEIGLLKVMGWNVIEELNLFISIGTTIPNEIENLTGINNEMLQKQGIPLKIALEKMKAFIETSPLLFHNARFDYGFFKVACKNSDVKLFTNRTIDTLPLARRKYSTMQDYSLISLAKHCNINTENAHRAIKDCYMTHQLYIKLNEK